MKDVSYRADGEDADPYPMGSDAAEWLKIGLMLVIGAAVVVAAMLYGERVWYSQPAEAFVGMSVQAVRLAHVGATTVSAIIGGILALALIYACLAPVILISDARLIRKQKAWRLRHGQMG